MLICFSLCVCLFAFLLKYARIAVRMVVCICVVSLSNKTLSLIYFVTRRI
jgi:hypothetical protein